MQKVVLVLHGFPGLPAKYGIRDYIKLHNYEGVIPDIFDESFLFEKKGIIDFIDKCLDGRKPDMIVAFSLGGLIAPWVAEKYPDSKLILVATGPHVAIGIRSYDYIIKELNLEIFNIILKILSHLPFYIYKMSFVLFNPFKGPEERRNIYYEDIRETYGMFIKHKPKKLNEIIKFVREIDNTEILKSLKNETLIIAGGNDVMMPVKLSFELKALINTSDLIKNKGRLHHEVFDERDFGKLDEFLNA